MVVPLISASLFGHTNCNGDNCKVAPEAKGVAGGGAAGSDGGGTDDGGGFCKSDQQRKGEDRLHRVKDNEKRARVGFAAEPPVALAVYEGGGRRWVSQSGKEKISAFCWRCVGRKSNP
ncbi:unnamed protein product [Lactuca virosa]|uniref:Uncharacterized protein n=1 Tax=Lactuca virosa TaxID=75947 RepID=A0AAU9N9R2_9ASTR|nr:unnamed protein product [Lactuca virosa]